MNHDKPFRIECFSEHTGWLLYALASNIDEARSKASHAILVTKHTQVKIVEASQ